MRIARIVHGGVAEGPGPRTVIWFQGCPIRCPGCYNPALWPTEGGREMSLSWVIAQAEGGLARGDVGVSLVGGEPLAQPEACADLCTALARLKIHTIVYTGLVYEDILSLMEAIPAYWAVLDHANVLVDGPFVKRHYNADIAYRGSRNQRVIDLALTREYGQPILVGAQWDRRQAITIRPGGTITLPARMARLFAGKRARARNCGHAPGAFRHGRH